MYPIWTHLYTFCTNYSYNIFNELGSNPQITWFQTKDTNRPNTINHLVGQTPDPVAHHPSTRYLILCMQAWLTASSVGHSVLMYVLLAVSTIVLVSDWLTVVHGSD